MSFPSRPRKSLEYSSEEGDHASYLLYGKIFLRAKGPQTPSRASQHLWATLQVTFTGPRLWWEDLGPRPGFLCPQASNKCRSFCQELLQCVNSRQRNFPLPHSCACQSSGDHSLTDWKSVSQSGEGWLSSKALWRALRLGLALLHARLPLWAEHSQVQCHACQLLL